MGLGLPITGCYFKRFFVLLAGGKRQILFSGKASQKITFQNECILAFVKISVMTSYA